MCASEVTDPFSSAEAHQAATGKFATPEPKKTLTVKRALKSVSKGIPQTTADFEKLLSSAAEKVPATDYIIMTAGFIAGTQGYTPLTKLMSIFGSATGGSGNWWNVDTSKDDWLVTMLFGPPGQRGVIGNTLFPGSPESAKQFVDLRNMMAMGAVGLIEAYAITRPGAFAAIGQTVAGIIHGIGEIVPG